MSCCCDSEKRIIIVWGDDTDFEGQTFVTINLTSNVWDLSKMSASFELGEVVKTFDDISSGVIGLSYTAEETKKMPFGNIYGTLRVFNKDDQTQTIDSIVPFRVVSLVSGQTVETEPYTLNIDVERAGETVMNIDITTRPAFSLVLGTVETLPSGSDAYVNITSSGTVYTMDIGLPRGIQGEAGKDGADGKDGIDGKDGVDGKDGKDGLNGTNGKDGVDGKDGVNGKDGVDGKDGVNGKDGVDGKDGVNGKDGLNGKDGADGKDGKDGVDGLNGQDGKDGKDGVDGKDAIINGQNTLTISASGGIQFVQNDSVAIINGSLLQLKANLVTSVSSSSTDSEYPSAKLFYDTVGDIEALINAL